MRRAQSLRAHQPAMPILAAPRVRVEAYRVAFLCVQSSFRLLAFLYRLAAWLSQRWCWLHRGITKETDSGGWIQVAVDELPG